MKFKLFLFTLFFSALTGCSSRLPTAQPTAIQINTITPSPTLTSSLTTTPSPFPTSTPSITPIASITPQPGFDIWDAGSVVGYYTIQFPKDQWIEGPSLLKHKTLQGCSIGLHGGSDVCMSGGCEETGIILGDAGFSKTIVGESFSIYVSRAVRSWISYEIQAVELPQKCIQAGEEVLATIKLRPERGCSDRAEFVDDVTIPDNTSIPAGTTFTKTWRIKNVGTCRWTREYSLYLVGRIPSGDFFQMSNLQEVVYPNQTVDLSVELTAPPVQGIARWEWMLQNEVQDQFGVGKRSYVQMPGDPIWVQINVVPAPTP